LDCPMSSTYASPLDLVERGLDELAAIGPELRTVAERQEFLLRISRVIGRAEAERLRVLAASDDIAVATGDRSTATWLATQTREAHGPYAGTRRWLTLSVRGGRRPPMRWVPGT
jgi:hypothetical protein